ncbi:hypothetical protein RSSM_04342 [Rhodopirellula sallentina SM41]|uniref:Uncharacterized protein n=1 Tax=Rhodopirellula sallentina SM41 TaxID=1263870 RepID=M5TYB8_9BACT|nr:hypothetical protein RSSM_04342 [Rhodopirellula sallentina SM41]
MFPAPGSAGTVSPVSVPVESTTGTAAKPILDQTMNAKTKAPAITTPTDRFCQARRDAMLQAPVRHSKGLENVIA